MDNETDILFNKFFIPDNTNKVSFTVLSDKLNLDEESLLLYLTGKKLEVIEKKERKYLIGWRYRDEVRTPAQNYKQIFNTNSGQKYQPFKQSINNSESQKLNPITEENEMEKYKLSLQQLERQQIELEEYKRKLRAKNKEIDEYRDAIKRHTKEKLEMEDLHRNKIEEMVERISLGHSLNERIQSILNKTKKDLETLSGKSVKILLLTDFHENDKLHNRSLFIPKDQDYNFVIGHETKHHNPDLRTHFN